MNSPRHSARFDTKGFISAQLAIVIAVIVGGGVVLAYEWRNADSAKAHELLPFHHRHHNAHSNAGE